MAAKKKPAEKKPRKPVVIPRKPNKPEIMQQKDALGESRTITQRVFAHMATHDLGPEKAWSAVNAGGVCGVCKERIE